jgi:hypothetical protein
MGTTLWPSRLGRPMVQRYGNLIWLALMPLGEYAIDGGPGASSVRYRFKPLIRRPRAALAVALAGVPASLPHGRWRHAGVLPAGQTSACYA